MLIAWQMINTMMVPFRNTQLLDCLTGGVDNTVTHTNNVDKASIEVDYYPPEGVAITDVTFE